ncbi:hypothetical protein [Nocardioides pyridinolyticus]
MATPKADGYRSLHAIIEIPVFLSSGPVSVPVELQLRSIAMDFCQPRAQDLLQVRRGGPRRAAARAQRGRADRQRAGLTDGAAAPRTTWLTSAGTRTSTLRRFP